ncbi:TPA: hypothetical protein SMV72_003365 [Proteus mirabilis]|nr:hypothetical protein [Proteus mirabilis]
MKITSVLFDTYYPIKPVTKITEDFSVDKIPPVEPIYEQRFDTYHPSAPANPFEEDLYCRLLRHQRDFVPRMNLYLSGVIGAIRVATNSTSTFFRRSQRRIEAIAMGCNIKEEHSSPARKGYLSGAFISIDNLAQ